MCQQGFGHAGLGEKGNGASQGFGWAGGEQGVSPGEFGGAGLGETRILRAEALSLVGKAEGAGGETALGTAHSSLHVPMRRTPGRQSQVLPSGAWWEDKEQWASPKTRENLPGCQAKLFSPGQ